MELFKGYNTWTGMPANTIAKAKGEVHDEDIGIKSYVKLCTDNVDLFKSLEVDASVSGSYGGFSADAKSSFYRSLNLTTNSVTLLVYTASTKLRSAGGVQIDESEEKKLADGKEIARFVQKYGDSWVSSIVTGTYYAAAFVFYAETKEQKTKVAVSLGAKYSGAGASVDASLKSDIENTLKETHVRCEVHQDVGGIAKETLPKIDSSDPAGSAQGIIDYAGKFATLKADNPATVEYTVRGYETAFDTNVPFQSVIDNRRAFIGDDATSGLGANHQKLTQLKNKIEDTEAFYSFYGVSPDAGLESKKTKVLADLRSLLDLINAMGDHPDEKHDVPALESLGYGTPQPDIEFVNPAGWGALEDTSHPPFDDVTADMVYGRCRIAEIAIRHGDRLDCLIVTYEVAGHELEPCIHGNIKGPNEEHVSLSGATTPPEMIRMIQAYGGGWPGTSAVNRIWFETTTGQSIKTVHPDGADKGNIQNHPSSPAWTYTKGGDVLVGFKGHADNGLVILLQAVVVSFKETQWIPA